VAGSRRGARARRAGLARPRVEVRWEDLAVEARVLVGQRARPTVLSFYRNALLARHALYQTLPAPPAPGARAPFPPVQLRNC